MATPDDLTRLTRTSDLRLIAGRGHPGRGAWICTGSDACLDLAEANRAFPRAFRGPVAPDAVRALRDEWAGQEPDRRGDFVTGTPPARD